MSALCRAAVLRSAAMISFCLEELPCLLAGDTGAAVLERGCVGFRLLHTTYAWCLVYIPRIFSTLPATLLSGVSKIATSLLSQGVAFLTGPRKRGCVNLAFRRHDYLN